MSAPSPIPPLPTTTAPPPILSTAPLALPTAPLGSTAGASTGQSPPSSTGPPPPPSTAPLVYSPAEMTGVLNDLVTSVQGICLYLAGPYGLPPAASPTIATGPMLLSWQPPHPAASDAHARPLQPQLQLPPPPPWQPPHQGATAALVRPLQLQPAPPPHRSGLNGRPRPSRRPPPPPFPCSSCCHCRRLRRPAPG
nr:proline-rich receptor-like protein kinase PERK8 [Aegilops tauschii subsp. strangulata]